MLCIIILLRPIVRKTIRKKATNYNVKDLSAIIIQRIWRGYYIRKLKLLDCEKKSLQRYIKSKRKSVLIYRNGEVKLDFVPLPVTPSINIIYLENQCAELLKSIRIIKPNINPVEDPTFIPGTGSIKKDGNEIKTSDDVRRYLKRGDAFKFVGNEDGECKEFIFQVSTNYEILFTKNTIPLNIKYTGDDINDFKMTKLKSYNPPSKLTKTIINLKKNVNAIATGVNEEENIEDLNAKTRIIKYIISFSTRTTTTS